MLTRIITRCAVVINVLVIFALCTSVRNENVNYSDIIKFWRAKDVVYFSVNGLNEPKHSEAMCVLNQVLRIYETCVPLYFEVADESKLANDTIGNSKMSSLSLVFESSNSTLLPESGRIGRTVINIRNNSISIILNASIEFYLPRGCYVDARNDGSVYSSQTLLSFSAATHTVGAKAVRVKRVSLAKALMYEVGLLFGIGNASKPPDLFTESKNEKEPISLNAEAVNSLRNHFREKLRCAYGNQRAAAVTTTITSTATTITEKTGIFLPTNNISFSPQNIKRPVYRNEESNVIDKTGREALNNSIDICKEAPIFVSELFGETFLFGANLVLPLSDIHRHRQQELRRRLYDKDYDNEDVHNSEHENDKSALINEQTNIDPPNIDFDLENDNELDDAINNTRTQIAHRVPAYVTVDFFNYVKQTEKIRAVVQIGDYLIIFQQKSFVVTLANIRLVAYGSIRRCFRIEKAITGAVFLSNILYIFSAESYYKFPNLRVVDSDIVVNAAESSSQSQVRFSAADDAYFDTDYPTDDDDERCNLHKIISNWGRENTRVKQRPLRMWSSSLKRVDWVARIGKPILFVNNNSATVYYNRRKMYRSIPILEALFASECDALPLVRDRKQQRQT